MERNQSLINFDGAFRFPGATTPIVFRIFAGELDPTTNIFSAKAELMNTKRPSRAYTIHGKFNPETGDTSLVLDIPRVLGNANIGGIIETVRVDFNEDGYPVWGMTTIIVPLKFEGCLNLTYEESEADPSQGWSRVWQGEIPCNDPTSPENNHFWLDGTVELQLNELKPLS